MIKYSEMDFYSGVEMKAERFDDHGNLIVIYRRNERTLDWEVAEEVKPRLRNRMKPKIRVGLHSHEDIIKNREKNEDREETEEEQNKESEREPIPRYMTRAKKIMNQNKVGEFGGEFEVPQEY